MPVSEPETAVLVSGAALDKAWASACLVVGALMCFYGYRTFRLALGLFGILIGGYAAAVAGYQISGHDIWMSALCGVAGAVLGGVLLITLYFLGVFVAGAAAGGILGAVVAAHAPPAIRVVAISVVGTLGGLLALSARRGIIVLATALNGAALILSSLWLLLSGVGPATVCRQAAGSPFSPRLPEYLLAAAWVLLAGLGVWAQWSIGPPPEVEKTSGSG